MKEVKRKRGRPAKLVARRKRIVFRCDDEELEIIERAARISGLSISEYIRSRIYGDSVECIDRRKEEISSLYGVKNTDDNYNEYYEEVSEDEEYV